MAKNHSDKHRDLPVKTEGAGTYHIFLEQDYAQLPVYMNDLDCSGRKICIVTDSHVQPLYEKEVRELLQPVCAEICTYVLPAGEMHKNLDEVRSLYTFLISHSFDRKDILVALGGGVVGDLTGFAAATYLRGIRFIQIPTTLLAQVDSSIGGKTGVDLDSFKNMVGAFHQPSMVYINVKTLLTLNEEQFACGMGEVIKHGLIRDASYYEWVIDHMDEIGERSLSTLTEMIEGSIRIKRAVVEKDPLEKGERALLNFGHTLGHAIEKEKGFQLMHGQCISLGCVAAAYISWKRGLLEEDEFYEIRDMNVGFDLPISYDGITPGAIVEAARKDKKMDMGQIRFVLLRSIGDAFVDQTVSEQEMLDALTFLLADRS